MSELLHIVVMAKPPIPGRVKTRMQPQLSPKQSAQIHQAMLQCVMSRVYHITQQDPELVRLARCVLCLDQSLEGSENAALDPSTLKGWEVKPQGQGDLGDRLLEIWRELGGGPIVFLGSDSPDVPNDSLKHLFHQLLDSHFKENECWVGPVSDGGYWTLAARQLQPMLLKDIDWGSPRVLAQTYDRAETAGIVISNLPTWHDVDFFRDLEALQTRLDEASESKPHDVAIDELRSALRVILSTETH